MEKINNKHYANFKVRLMASLIDAMLGILILSLLLYYVAIQPTLSSLGFAAILSLVILLNPVYVYSSVLFTHYFQGTPGKLLLGLRVLAEDHKPLPFKRILFRQTVGYLFSWTFFGLGYFSVIKDEKKQAWHDKTIGSVVVAKGNLFIVGCMIALLLIFISISLFSASARTFIKSPLLKDIHAMKTQFEGEDERLRPSSFSETLRLYEKFTLQGKVLKKGEEVTGSRTVRYLYMLTSYDTKKYKVVYYDADKFDACWNPDLDNVAESITPGDTIEAYGEYSAEYTMYTCNSENYYINRISPKAPANL